MVDRLGDNKLVDGMVHGPCQITSIFTEKKPDWTMTSGSLVKIPIENLTSTILVFNGPMEKLNKH